MFEQIRKNFSPVRGSTLKGGGGYLTMFLEMMTRQVDILKAEFGDRLKFEEVKTFHFNIRIMKAWIK
ncbi:MAG: hypothetical protein LBI53_01920 [Candidatus Peribacteria bacterium]|nr:hypothetical protein [Candidatus Peribacteria bacterium]